ncbi:MAG: ribose transport system ATP-binding protein [Halanaerobiales bacterium]|nr:ribose transport system ATP-binding protein [Halanaerobiales bacterium]
MDKEELVLKAKGLTKTFPGVLALNNVDFELRKNEIHALVGENGAGKSTFSKILAGEHTPTKGEIYFNGERVNIHNTFHALNLGIGMVYQERNLVPHFTAVENIFLGKEILNFGFLCTDLMEEKVYSMMQKLGVEFEIDQPVNQLGPSKQQMVEIIKVLLLEPQVMIFDEPTSSLTKSETRAFFNLIKTLKERVSIIFISHRLEEVFEISDRITVFRDGKKISTVRTNEVSENDVIKMMVDREIKELYPKANISIGDSLLEVKDLNSGSLKGINFQARRREIVGFFGMVGSGRSELAEVIFGLRKLDKGEIIFEGEKVYPKSPEVMINKGVYFIPEDRRVQGLNLEMDVKTNLSVVHLPMVCSGPFIDRRKENSLANNLVEEFDIRVANLQQKVRNLSGGNQQKVVIGKWLARKAKMLIMDEATAGIDVGAKREIYKIMVDLAKNGISIIFISSDLPELMGMCDRIYVMNQGRITAEYHRENFSQQNILQNAVTDKKD